MKLSPRRYTVEEFPDQQSWIGNLLSPLNQSNQELFSGLNNNITIAENLYQEVKELKFTVDATTYPIRFKTKFNKHPLGINVIYCMDSTGGTASNTPWLTWSFADGLMTITNITNLTSSMTYTLRIHVIYA